MSAIGEKDRAEGKDLPLSPLSTATQGGSGAGVAA